MHRKKLVIIGGGAAGFFCAVNAARMNPGLAVQLVEKTGKLLSKVKVSGGGRCNVTHACFDIAEMCKRYPRGANFVKKTFRQFFTNDTIRWFAERGVTVKEEPDGRMFPVTDSSQTIIDCLVSEANKYGVEIVLQAEVKRIRTETSLSTGEKFTLELSGNRLLRADYTCVACGGYPKSFLFDWLKQTGHTIEDPVPSLFTFNLPAGLPPGGGQDGMSGHPITRLMGVSVEQAKIKITGTKLEQQGPLLITHWGLSGPAVLKLSAWGARELAKCNWQFQVSINWVQGYHEETLRRKFQELRSVSASQKIMNKNSFGLPSRLWEFLALQSGITNDRRWADLPSGEQNRFIKNLCNYECDVRGKTTFKEEFVTAGGIKLGEIDPATMMSRKVPGLFFAGEVLDVDGITGGYNFQHAWTSGYIAAASVAALAGGTV